MSAKKNGSRLASARGGLRPLCMVTMTLEPETLATIDAEADRRRLSRRVVLREILAVGMAARAVSFEVAR